MTHDEITKALSDEYWLVRYQALEHPNLTIEHITKALEDKSRTIRYRALRHPNVTEEHITKAMNDEDWMILLEASSVRVERFPWLLLDLPDANNYFEDILLNLLGTSR